MGSLNRKKPSDKKIKKAVLSGEARSKFEAHRKRMKANRDKGELLLERRSEMETKEPLENPQARYSSFRGDPSSCLGNYSPGISYYLIQLFLGLPDFLISLLNSY
jgi:hypothetical protein